MGDFSQDYIKAGEAIQSYLPLGLPADPTPSYPPPGLETTSGAVSNSEHLFPFVSQVWNVLKRDSESAADYVEQGIKSVYNTGKSAVGTVYDDVTKPLTSAVDNIYWKVLLAVVVIGGVVYYAGKSGALRASISR